MAKTSQIYWINKLFTELKGRKTEPNKNMACKSEITNPKSSTYFLVENMEMIMEICGSF